MTVKVLISRHDKIGDFVVTLPMFSVLKQQRPELELYALVSKVNYEFAQRVSYIDHVILFDSNDLKQTRKTIREAQIDVSISAFIDTKLAWLLFNSGIKKRIAPATKVSQIFFNKRITQRRSLVSKRELEYNLDLLLAFDPQLTLKYEQPLLNIAKSDKQRVIDNFRRQYNIVESAKLVVIHPGSGGSAEGNLTIEDYLSLAKSIIDLPNIKVVFTFGPDDLVIQKEISQSIDFDAILHSSSGSLYDFATLLSQSHLFVSTSTGTMHLAAASNVATVSFFGENLVSSPKRWASVSETSQQHNITLAKDYPESQLNQIKQQLQDILQ